MHVLQWIAVKADDEDLAMRIVEDTLNSELGRDEYGSHAWYDWFVIGGGRWNEEQDPYKSSTNMIIHLNKDPDRFEERILLSMEARKAEFDNYAKDVKPEMLTKVISNYNPREYDYEIFIDLYSIKKVVDMAFGEWDFNSYFFDMENNTTTPKYVFEAIDKQEYSWYLIPVDFHF